MKIIERIKKRFKFNKNTLTYQRVVIGLIILLFSLVFLNLLLRGELNFQGSGDDNTGNQGIDFIDDGDSRIPEGVKSIDYVDKSRKYAELIEYMPFYSDAFNVVYDHFLNEFKVYLNPASFADFEDIYEWFESFDDIESHTEVTIVFVDQFETGAPAGLPDEEI